MAHSSHRRCRGCVLCKPHQWKGQGKARKAPWSVIKRVDKKRRWN